MDGGDLPPPGEGGIERRKRLAAPALSSQDATLIPSRTLFIRPFRIRPSSFVLSSILRNTRGSRSCSSFAMNNWVSSSSREPRARRELRKFLAGSSVLRLLRYCWQPIRLLVAFGREGR